MGSHTLQSKGAIALIIVSAALAMFMSALDGTIVNIALPTISSDFGLTTSTVSWVSTIYLLVSAGSFFLMGKLINVAGYKKNLHLRIPSLHLRLFCLRIFAGRPRVLPSSAGIPCIPGTWRKYHDCYRPRDYLELSP